MYQPVEMKRGKINCDVAYELLVSHLAHVSLILNATNEDDNIFVENQPKRHAICY